MSDDWATAEVQKLYGSLLEFGYSIGYCKTAEGVAQEVSDWSKALRKDIAASLHAAIARGRQLEREGIHDDD